MYLQDKTLGYFSSMEGVENQQTRLQLRAEILESHKHLNKTVYKVGIRSKEHFAYFHNSGYKGLYNGETVYHIRKRKGLSASDNIFDYMGSVELATNWFRIVQIDSILQEEQIQSVMLACHKHFLVGKEIRKTIARFGGSMPELLPTYPNIFSL